jgi:hypothetical protein
VHSQIQHRMSESLWEWMLPSASHRVLILTCYLSFGEPKQTHTAFLKMNSEKTLKHLIILKIYIYIIYIYDFDFDSELYYIKYLWNMNFDPGLDFVRCHWFGPVSVSFSHTVTKT